MSDVSIYEEYVDLTRQYRAKYGPKTIVLLQVGAFFEVYGFLVGTDYSDETPVKEFSVMCGLNMMEKKTAVWHDLPVVGAGFRDYSLDKYVQCITEAGFTAVTFVQSASSSGTKLKRVLDCVYSSGTYVSQQQQQDVAQSRVTNNICCIWVELIHNRATRSGSRGLKREPVSQTSHGLQREPVSQTSHVSQMVFGMAVANMFTGTSSLCEWVQPFATEPSAFDKLERLVTVHGPSEFILVSNMEPAALGLLTQYSGIQTLLDDERRVLLHHVDLNSSAAAKNCMQQKYTRHVLSSLYGPHAVDMCHEFTQFPTATQAFCYLLDFIQEHNPNLVKNIDIPQFQHTERMLLANHTLRQLNIVGDHHGGNTSSSLRSVESLLNQCCTAMGKRRFHEQLLHPTTDVEWLEHEYAWTDALLSSSNNGVHLLRPHLQDMCDVEKMTRQLVLRKLTPSALVKLHATCSATLRCLDYPETRAIAGYFYDTDDFAFIRRRVDSVLQFLEDHFVLDRCAAVQSMTSFGEESIFCRGVSDALDAGIVAYESSKELFHAIHHVLNDLMQTSQPGQFVRIHETEKSGVSLQITKKRARVLKEKLGKPIPTSLLETYPIFSRVVPAIQWSELTFRHASGTNDEISCPQLTEVCATMLTQKEELQQLMASTYVDVLETLEQRFHSSLTDAAKWIGQLDVLVCKAFVARKYKYCRPTTLAQQSIPYDGASLAQQSIPPYDGASPFTTTTSSFVRATQLRHALIEHLQTQETYVANDVHLDQNGILLYGTNAVGKTSLIRALGIAVILAQAGMYVPCTEFVFRPYSAIFSRILANDNLFKGLSTFAVEMSELRVILKMADANSLILGDELCSGTETESALSIFVAGLTTLQSKRASYLFATHFHEILRFEEVRRLYTSSDESSSRHLRIQHMAVHYDRETDALVYDRVLREGPGDRMYGLEVCKSLHLPPDFLDLAYAMRTKYFPTARGDLQLTSSVYNSQKLRGRCELCHEEMSTETHHKVPQRLADADGFVTTSRGVFHKNHAANLQSVCEACHLRVHGR